MSRFYGVSRGWRIIAILLAVVVIAIGVIALIAGIKSAQDNIGFFDALGKMFTFSKETSESVAENISLVA